MIKNILLFCSSDEIYSYKLCKLISEYKKFKVKIIIFPSKIVKIKIFKIKKLFNFILIILKENFPKPSKKIKQFFKENKIDLGINTSWSYRIRKSFINLFDYGIINFHPAPLPINKGCHAAFWGIYLDKKHGCTMHLMSKKFDDGPILDQIVYKNTDDLIAEDVWKKSHSLSVDLLKRNLNNIYMKKIKLKKNSKGNYNNKKKIIRTTTLKEKQKITVQNLWRIIKGVNFKKNGFFIITKKNKYKIIPKIIKVN